MSFMIQHMADGKTPADANTDPLHKGLLSKHHAYDQFGLNLQLNKYFGLGKFGQRVKW